VYVKIFQSIYDGSLVAGPHAWEAIDTLMHLLVLADKDGIVDMTPTAIHARTQVPVDFLERGLAELEKPDQDSRNPAEDGRRIVRLDDHRTWGWQIVNHKFYRNLRKAEDRKEYFRLKKQEYREREQLSTHVHTCPQMSTMSTEAEAEAKAEAELVKEKSLKKDSKRKNEDNLEDKSGRGRTRKTQSESELVKEKSLKKDSKRKCVWPKNFKLTTDLRMYALKHKIADPDAEFENFMIKAQAHGYKYVNWDMAWMNWCRSPYQQSTREKGYFE